MITERQRLLGRHRDLIKRAESTIKASDIEGRALTPIEDAQVSAWLDEIESIQATLNPDDPGGESRDRNPGERIESSRAWGKRPQASTPQPDPMLGTNIGGKPTWAPGAPRSPANGTTSGKRFCEMFPAARIDGGGWKDPNEFFGVLHSNLSDPRLVPLAAMGESTSSGGGFAVPSEMTAEWLDSALESEIVRPRATVWPMTSATRKVPGWEDSDNSSTLFGGFSHQWLSENTSATDSDPKLRSIQLVAKKLALFTKASNELIADGLSLESQLDSAMIRATGFSLDYSFLRGTGAGQPLGVLNAPSLVTASKETAQVAGTLTYGNLCAMFARLAPGCVPNSVWVASVSCIPQLAQLSIILGTGGSHIPVMTSDNGEFHVLTRPVVFTEKLPALGTVGDILLVDFSQYAVGIRQEMSVESSRHVGWQSDQTGYRCIIRVDGQPTWASAHTPRNGGDSLSWAVALETR